MQHIINHWSGGDGGFLYDLYSGLLPFICGLGFLGGLGMAYKRLQCHDDSCHKIGLHHVAGGQFTVCRSHYKTVMGLHKDHKFTIHHIKAAHEEHLDRTSTS